MVYVDPLKLEAYQLSSMDVVRAVNNANLILPAGDVKIGPIDYTLYTNSQLPHDRRHQPPAAEDRRRAPRSWSATSATRRTPTQIQTNIVRVDGQRSVYLPVLKQGGDTNTIAVVDGVKEAVSGLLDIPKQLVANVVFDQSLFVKQARSRTCSTRAASACVLTGADGPALPRQLPRDGRACSCRFRCRRSPRSSRSTSAAARSTR